MALFCFLTGVDRREKRMTLNDRQANGARGQKQVTRFGGEVCGLAVQLMAAGVKSVIS